MIKEVNLPRICAGCNAEVIGYDKALLSNLVALDFRMSDFSTATITFCDRCAIKVGPEHFTDLQDMILRGWVISCLISGMYTQESFIAGQVRESAARDWDAFARNYLPLRGGAADSFAKQKSPHVRYEGGLGIKWATRMPFPILGIARWRVPSGLGSELSLTTKGEVEKRVRERDGE